MRALFIPLTKVHFKRFCWVDESLKHGADQSPEAKINDLKFAKKKCIVFLLHPALEMVIMRNRKTELYEIQTLPRRNVLVWTENN